MVSSQESLLKGILTSKDCLKIVGSTSQSRQTFAQPSPTGGGFKYPPVGQSALPKKPEKHRASFFKSDKEWFQIFCIFTLPVRSGLNSHYFHIIGDKLINPLVGVYIPIIRIPIKGGMTIPNIATFDHGTPGEMVQFDLRIFFNWVGSTT